MRKALVLVLLFCMGACASGERTPSDGAREGGSSTGTLTSASASSGPDRVAFDPSKPLTLEESVRLAATASLTARGFAARLEAARGAATTAATWPNPTVDWHAEQIGLVVDHKRQILQQETVSYPVFFWWTKGLEKDVADAELARTAASVEDDARQLRLSAGQTFLELLAEDEEARNLEETAAIASRLADAARIRRRVGDASALDEQRARTESLDARRDLLAARRRRAVDGIALALVLGAEQPVPVVPAPGWPLELPADVAAESSAGAARLVERAIAARPDLREAEANVLRATKAAALEDRKAIPLADWVLLAGGQQAPEGNGAIIETSGPVPVFDRNQGNRARAKAELDGALADLERARRQVAFEVESALLSYRQAAAALDELSRPIARAREEALEAARRLFAAGEVGYLDLLQAQRDAVAARKDLVDAEKEAAVARWKLLVALGR